MKLEERGFSGREATMRRRVVMLFLVLGLGVCRSDGASAQVDCVYPTRVDVSRAQGHVFDPFGAVVPGVIVTLTGERGAIQRTTTDNQGRFRLHASRGNYSFRAALPMFEVSQTHLNIGEDLSSVVRPRSLRVILGINGLFCP